MDICAKEIKEKRNKNYNNKKRVAIISLDRPSRKKDKKKSPGPHTPKSIHRSFFSQMEN